MKTPQEAERVKQVEQAFHHLQQTMIPEVFGDALSPDMVALILGSMLAAVDATFAIRDGESWRGLNDPKEIATRLLRDAQLGE